MNNIGFLRQYLQNQLDKIASVIGIILGVIISLMNLIYSNEYLITIGPMLIIVCGCYLLFGNKLKAMYLELQAGRSFILVTNIMYWLCFAVSIFILRTAILHRPVMYFVLTSIAASMIALQIVYLRNKSTEYLILFEILLLSLSAAASAFWVFPSLVGIDPWAHLIYIEDFVNSGHVESSMGLISYLYYPITHLSVAGMKLITALDYKEAMFLGIGLPLILSSVFVYLIGCRLANAKVGLLATLLVNLADVHMQFGIQLIATTFGIMLFTIIYYLIIHDKGKLDIKVIVLALLLLLVMVITHTMSSFVMVLFILCLLIGHYAYNALYKKQSNVNMGMISPILLMFFIVAMLSYWIFAGAGEGGDFFLTIVRGLMSSLEESTGFLDRSTSPTSAYGYLGPILHIAGYIIIYTLGTMGVLILLSRQYLNKSRLALIAPVVLMTAFALVFPVFGLRNIMPYRWYAFIYVPLGILASFAVLYIIQSISRFNLRNITLVLIVSVLVFFMITNKFSNVDSPIYASNLTQRLVYSDSEIAAGKKVIDIYDGLIVVDLNYVWAILGFHLGTTVPTSSNMQDDEVINNGLVIWREVMANTPVRVTGGITVLGTSYEHKLELFHDLIYSNNAVKVFLPVNK